mmetsp:Transcript_31953/g.77526  ORF Transcript_31953/g.77526 Transcript_31953/m.77526 type:complete len:462 (-) Transcript_31953:1029-2414(-)
MDDDILDDVQHRPSSSLLTCSFNQDGGCLAVGTTTGFSVHNLHPQYSQTVERELRGGIGQVEMLFRCNLMAIVGGGSTPHSAPHRVLIWDDHVPKEIGELSFRQVVLSVKLRKDAIAISLKDRVYVYNLADLTLRDKIYTAENPHGLLSLSTQVQEMVLACPSVTPGHVRVELYGLRKTVLLEAHDGELRGLCLTANGNKLATASVKGTIIRVWDIASKSCIHEFRRGVERATITCLAFSWDDQWLSSCSDKGTVHIFHCKEESEEGKKKSSKSTFSRLLSSTTSQKPKSICQIRGIPHPIACAFVGDVPNMIAISGWDADGNGVLLMSEFAAHQEARRVAYHVLVKNSVEETEEERRRRRARGWKPKVPDTPDNDFGNMQITEPSMNHLSTQNTDDDFCEVVFEPPKEPAIEGKPNADDPPTSSDDGKKKSAAPNGGGNQDKDKEAGEDENLDEFLEATQ